MSISETHFQYELNRISNIEIRNLVVYLLDNRIPSDIWMKASSSSQKYHPLNKEGNPESTLEHTKSVFRIVYTLCDHPNIKDVVFDALARDLLLASALLHDSIKYGYPEACEHTVFEHPILIKTLIDDTIANNPQWFQYFTEIADIISAHHGPWNTSKYHDYSLPLITSDKQWYLHLADYLASRVYIRVDYDSTI